MKLFSFIISKTFFFRFIAGALSRALSLQETIDKHSKIQALAGLICTMIESCPSTQSQQQTLPLYRQLQVSFAPFFEFSFLSLDEKMGSNWNCYFASFRCSISILDLSPLFWRKNGVEFCISLISGQFQYNMNNMVKVMLKKGIINDLARVTHSLDLSSPNVAATVNAVLKPLETLSRIVNQPTGLGPGAQRGGSKNKTGSGGNYLHI